MGVNHFYLGFLWYLETKISVNNRLSANTRALADLIGGNSNFPQLDLPMREWPINQGIQILQIVFRSHSFCFHQDYIYQITLGSFAGNW